MQQTTINSINAFVQATLLQECITFQINPLELSNLENGERHDLNVFICKAEKQLIEHHYLALYINRDEPALAMEHANSRLELASLYEDEAIHKNSLDCLEGITSIHTFEYQGITYTIETLEDI